MATVRAGEQPVLVVVDVQVGVMEECWDAARVVERVARVVGRARDAGVPVLWVQHEDEQLARGSDAWQWVGALMPAEGEPRVHKRHHSAFEQTPLESELERLRATRIVLAGAASNWCIRATAYGALDRGYDLTLVRDAHTTGSMTLPDGHVVEAEAVVREFNATFGWLGYPGRRCAVEASDGPLFECAPR